MKRPMITAILAAALGLFGLSAAGGASAETTNSAQFTGTVGELVDTSTVGTSFPTGFVRHVGNPAPDGYAHDYQWGAPAITTPADAVVTFTGTVDVVDAVEGDLAFVGLLDTATLAAGGRGRHEGSYVYAFMKGADTLVLGLSDGRDRGHEGGEYVQVFHTIDLTGSDRILDVTFTIAPGDLSATDTCASHPSDVPTADGCMTLAVDELDVLTDSYGTVTDDDVNGGVEFRDGGTAGWDGAYNVAATGIDYNLTVTPVIVSRPRTKDDCKHGGYADFGYKNQGECVSDVEKSDKADKADKLKKDKHEGRDH